MTTRIEKDAMGEIEVPAERLWGAQTQRSLTHFRISDERMPEALIDALAAIKHACALTHRDLGWLPADQAEAIARAAEEVINGQHRVEFPLLVWQTGSGTQTNMNMNEVLANRASELLGGPRGLDRVVHANDAVNLGQSSNDVFPTAMHVAACVALEQRLLPALRALRATLQGQAHAWADIVKIGRTHLQDAVPLTLGQEWSAYAAHLAHAEAAILAAMPALGELAIGGTAVGTGLNAHPEAAPRIVAALAERYGLPFIPAANRFAALAGHDALVSMHGALRMLATALAKIANDIRWLASGPRCGLAELIIPDNEPGSSMMPGKVNPTQCEALLMACCQVMGNDVAIGMGAATGNFELNVSKPLIIHAFLNSTRLLGDGMASFDVHCVRGIVPDRERLAELVGASLMLVTALVPHIGYDRAAAIAQHAHRERISLRQAALTLGLSAEAFDGWLRIDPASHPHSG